MTIGFSSNNLPAEKSRTSRYWLAFFLYLGFATLTSIWFLYSNAQISGDQITYLTTARVFASSDELWLAHNALSSILAMLFNKTELRDESAFILIYFFVTIAYLNAFHFGIGRWIKDPTVRILVSIISTAPFYTLGMTHWGFAEFELIRGRIFSTIFAPIAIRWFFDYRHTPQGSLAYILVGLVSASLSLEATFLLPIFLVTALVLLVSDKGARLGAKALMHLMCFALGTAIIALTMWDNILPLSEFAHTANISGYEGLGMVTPEDLGMVTPEGLVPVTQTVSLLWEINYFGFWWAMFPPRLSDLAYMIVGGFPIFFIVALSIVKSNWSTRSPFSRELWIFFFAALITAYGYQVVLFLGWKLFNLPPSHFEEVRAVKYALFPCFIFVGFVAHFLLDHRRYLPLCVMIFSLILNPYRVSKISPDVLKQQIFNNLAPYFSERSKLDYLEKALDLNNAANADKVQIFRILEQQARKHSIILSDINELRALGFTPWVNYESKSEFAYGLSKIFPRFDKELALRSVRWYTAYRESQVAILGGETEALLQLMKHLEIEWTITSKNHNHPALETVYSGESLFLLRLKH